LLWRLELSLDVFEVVKMALFFNLSFQLRLDVLRLHHRCHFFALPGLEIRRLVRIDEGLAALGVFGGVLHLFGRFQVLGHRRFKDLGQLVFCEG